MTSRTLLNLLDPGEGNNVTPCATPCTTSRTSSVDNHYIRTSFTQTQQFSQKDLYQEDPKQYEYASESYYHNLLWFFPRQFRAWVKSIQHSLSKQEKLDFLQANNSGGDEKAGVNARNKGKLADEAARNAQNESMNRRIGAAMKDIDGENNFGKTPESGESAGEVGEEGTPNLPPTPTKLVFTPRDNLSELEKDKIIHYLRGVRTFDGNAPTEKGKVAEAMAGAWSKVMEGSDGSSSSSSGGSSSSSSSGPDSSSVTSSFSDPRQAMQIRLLARAQEHRLIQQEMAHDLQIQLQKDIEKFNMEDQVKQKGGIKEADLAKEFEDSLGNAEAEGESNLQSKLEKLLAKRSGPLSMELADQYLKVLRKIQKIEFEAYKKLDQFNIGGLVREGGSQKRIGEGAGDAPKGETEDVQKTAALQIGGEEGKEVKIAEGKGSEAPFLEVKLS